MIKKITITLGVALAFNMGLYAQSIDAAKLNSYFKVLEENNKFMGTAAVSKNGSVVYEQASGYADISSKKKNNTKTKYRIGSVSKTFTSVLTLKAAELKKLKLEDKISIYFPNLNNADKITISDLLYHRSGIHSFTDEMEYLSYYTSKKTRAEMLQIINKYPADFEAGANAEYSNSNYVLLSYIVEDVFKTDYTTALNTYIVKPLKLESTFLGGKIHLENEEAYSYDYEGKWVKSEETDISVPMGAGGIVSTPADLMKFIEGLFSGKIISKTSLDKMITLKDDYGMGIFSFPFNNEVGYGHDGSIDGYRSMVSYYPDSGIATAVIANGSNMNLADVNTVLLKAANQMPFEIPNFNKRTVTSADLDVYLGTYTSEQIPLKITISKKENVLYAQATGQLAFPMEALEDHRFSFETAGIVIQFNVKDHSFTLNQGGGKFVFTKE